MHSSWKEVLSEEMEKPYFSHLMEKVGYLYQTDLIYPPQDKIFRALEIPYHEVKVLILGQDPYHGAGQANGLAFAVNTGIPTPSSLKNIFKEIKKEYGVTPLKADLINWADQGVLLLNSILTVRDKSPASHQKLGWQSFTDAIISALSKRERPLVFMLWGNQAKKKKDLIDGSRHLILETSHPSPLSVHQGFLGCNHFKLANGWIRNLNPPQEPIDWINS